MAKATTTLEPELVAEKVELISEAEQSTALATIKPADLTVLNEIDEKIKNFRDNYSTLEIEDEDDKDGYERVRQALGDMRPTRTELSAQRKDITKPYLATAKFISSKFNEKINEIAAIEGPLKERKKEIDDIEKRQKEEEIRQKEIQLNNRISELINAGCVFDGSYYAFEGVPSMNISTSTIGVVDIRVMSDEIFKQFHQTILDKAAMVKNEQARLDKIKEQEEAAEKQRKELQEKQDQIDRDRRAKEEEDFKKQREDFLEEQRKFQEQKDAAELENKRKQEEREAQERAAAQAIFNRRDTHLQNLGFKRYGEVYQAFGEFYFSVSEVVGEESEYKALLAKHLPILEAKTKEVEDKREADRLVEEKRIADKAIADKAEADRLQKIRDEEELAKASDKKKFDVFIAALKAVSVPEMKNPTYKKRVFEITEFLKSL